MDEISNYMAALGLFSQLPFYIINDLVSQILQNYLLNHIYQNALVIVYLSRIAVRIINLRFWILKVTHIDRMKICAVMLFFSYALIAGLLLYYSDLNNIGKIRPNKHILTLVLSTSLWLSGVGAALSESTIVGYLKCFHPD